jgi:hypothetical protein
MRIAVALLAAFLLQDEGTRFEHKYSKGSVRKFKVVASQKTAMDMGGTDMGSSSESTQVLREEVLDADDKGGAKMKTTFAEMKMKFRQGGEETTFDSTKKEDQEKLEGNMMLQMMAAYAGKSVTYNAAKTGAISKIDTAEIQEALGENQMGPMVEGMVRQMIELTAIVFPDKPIKKGESWKRQSSVEMGMVGTLKIDVESTHAGTDKVGDVECAKFTSKITIAFDTGENGMVKIEIKSQENSGATWFDPARGEIMKSTYKTKMKMGIEAGGQEFEQEQESSYEMERVKDW